MKTSELHPHFVVVVITVMWSNYIGIKTTSTSYLYIQEAIGF